MTDVSYALYGNQCDIFPMEKTSNLKPSEK